MNLTGKDILRFTPLQTYKVLKRVTNAYKYVWSFTPLQTYKVLKPIPNCAAAWLFYTITNLQGSQTLNWKQATSEMFYTITNLQGSQTPFAVIAQIQPFYTITNLQGSQTASSNLPVNSCFTPLQTYKVLKPQMRSSPSQTYRSICVSHLVMYKTHVFIY